MTASRRAFTLLQLLFSLTALALLFALLVPAVAKARFAAGSPGAFGRTTLEADPGHGDAQLSRHLCGCSRRATTPTTFSALAKIFCRTSRNSKPSK